MILSKPHDDAIPFYLNSLHSTSPIHTSLHFPLFLMQLHTDGLIPSISFRLISLVRIHASFSLTGLLPTQHSLSQSIAIPVLKQFHSRQTTHCSTLRQSH